MATVGRNRSRETRERRRHSRRELFVSPALIPKCSEVSSGASGKHKLCEDREELKRRNCGQEGVLSDSENEEPLSRRIRTISAFIRKTKHSAACTGGGQRSQSCSDPLEDRAERLKAPHPPLMDRVGHSFTAGILLSSENSRCSSAPPSDRRLPWRPFLPSSSPFAPPRPPPPERSVSPESNDSISEELNHFKPIVCSPCTPPKRLPDGRLLQPTVVKSTPRNLSRRGLQRPTSYEAGPAVLQKWRQIELDRQNLKLCRPGGAGADPPSIRLSDSPSLTLRLSDSDSLTLAGRCGEAACRASSDPPESCGRKRSFSAYTKNSGIQTCNQSPRKESDRSASQRGCKRQQKTRHLDSDPDKRRTRVQQQDRALALRLQRQFDLETSSRPDAYFLRSWRSNQNRRRRGLRRSRRISTKH
ncbi:hypothetical protein PBY51_009190 [Eleginops maclovinus]|uniref:RING-type E3 ubiquitin transferase n=1 Tax=Eleginops maclovinus TaxID=56733 RepID=A0AAN7XY36_ELEMC|nr:hypothetical protein PBY51_009190 [Eleginops maclovinus]